MNSAGQQRPDPRQWCDQAGARIRRTADNLHGLITAVINTAKLQLVGLRMRLAVNDARHHHVVELSLHRQHAVDFKSGGGETLGQFIGIEGGAGQFCQPGNTALHVNCSRKPRSLSKNWRRSVTP